MFALVATIGYPSPVLFVSAMSQFAMEPIDPLRDKLLPVTPVEGYTNSVQKITGKKSATVIRWTKRVLPLIKIGGSWYTTEDAFRQACRHGGVSTETAKAHGATDSASKEQAIVASLRTRIHRGKT